MTIIEYSINGGANWHVAAPGQAITVPEGLEILTRPRHDAAQASQAASLAVIQFVLDAEDEVNAVCFLRNWNDGEFDFCRRNWPEAPDDVYLGADLMHSSTKPAQTSARAVVTPPQLMARMVEATARWDFIMSLADHPTGVDASALETDPDSPFESTRPKSVQLAETIDAARASKP